jgi:hypothetical protein
MLQKCGENDLVFGPGGDARPCRSLFGKRSDAWGVAKDPGARRRDGGTKAQSGPAALALSVVTVQLAKRPGWICSACVIELRDEMSEAQSGNSNDLGGIPIPPLKRRRAETIRPAAVVQRLWRAADRQIAESERRMQSDADEAIEREARTLSMLGKLVRELAEIDLKNGMPPRRTRGARRPVIRSGLGDSGGDSDHADAIDVAEFRAELAQRLDRLRSERADGGAAGGAGSFGA